MVAAAGSTPAASLRKKNTATTRTRLTPTTSPSLASLGMGEELRDQSARTTLLSPLTTVRAAVLHEKTTVSRRRARQKRQVTNPWSGLHFRSYGANAHFWIAKRWMSFASPTSEM